MSFGQKLPGRRGRPPKDPALRAARAAEDFDDIAISSSRQDAATKLRKTQEGDVSSGSLIDAQLAAHTPESAEAVLQDLRLRYEQKFKDQIAQVRCILVFLLTKITDERNAIQTQFDRLKGLRLTQSEITLAEWKGIAETRERRVYHFLVS